MKFLKLFLAITIFGIAPASANDQGAWVKVDSLGNVTSNAIVCTSDVCGNPDSLYSKMTLAQGERYVLQFAADPETGNVAGIGNNNPGLEVKVDLETNKWTTQSTKIINTPDLGATRQTTITTWNSGELTENRKSTTTVEKITPTAELWNWDYLLSLSYGDLLKWFEDWINTIYSK